MIDEIFYEVLNPIDAGTGCIFLSSKKIVKSFIWSVIVSYKQDDYEVLKCKKIKKEEKFKKEKSVKKNLKKESD